MLLFSEWNDTVIEKYPDAAFLLEARLSHQDSFSAPGWAVWFWSSSSGPDTKVPALTEQ